MAYAALIAHQDCQTHVGNVSDVKCVPCSKAVARKLAFDHSDILKTARERLKQKALYSIVPVYALPEEFTFPELQRLHEVLVDMPLQKKSFRRRIEQADLIEEVGIKCLCELEVHSFVRGYSSLRTVHSFDPQGIHQCHHLLKFVKRLGAVN